MTRIHFEFIAAVVRSMPDLQARNLAARIFAESLHKTNGRFDENRFFVACSDGPQTRAV
jgi:hypothetical protein